VRADSRSHAARNADAVAAPCCVVVPVPPVIPCGCAAAAAAAAASRANGEKRSTVTWLRMHGTSVVTPSVSVTACALCTITCAYTVRTACF